MDDRMTKLAVVVGWILYTAAIGTHIVAVSSVSVGIVAVIVSVLFPLMAILFEVSEVKSGCFTLIVAFVWSAFAVWASITLLIQAISVFLGFLIGITLFVIWIYFFMEFLKVLKV